MLLPLGIVLASLVVAESPEISEPPRDPEHPFNPSSDARVSVANGGEPFEAESTTIRSAAPEAFPPVAILRIGGVLMFAFQTAYLLVADEIRWVPSANLVALHLAGVFLGAFLFALSFTEWCRDHWRSASLSLCAAQIAVVLAIAGIRNDPETLFVAIFAIVIGASALVPWEARWQVALSAVGLTAFTIMSHWSHQSSIATLWLGVIIAVVLAQATVVMASRYRRALEAQIAALGASHRQLRTEMAERAEIERRSRDRAATFRSVFENLSEIAIIGTLTDHTFVDVNRAFEEASGRTREQLIGRPIAELDLWVNQQDRARMLAELAAGRTVRNLETEFRLGDGRVISSLVASVPMQLGGLPCAVTLIRDVTAIRDAQRRIESSESDLRRILDACPEGVTITRVRDSKYTYANRAVLHHTRFRPDQIIEHTDSDLCLWPDQTIRREFARRIAHDGAVNNLEVELCGSGGRMLPSLISAVQMNVGGELCIVAFTREIEQIKQKERELEAARSELARQLDALRSSEARLAESEAKLRTIFNANRDFITINSFPDGVYLEVNDETVSHMGLSRERILGRHAQDLGLWADPSQRLHYLNEIGKSGEVRNLEVDLRIKGKIVPHLISGVLIELSGHKALLSIARDISEFRAAQERLRESEATLRKVFDANFDSISINDLATGHYLDVNGTFASNTGLSRDSVLGKDSSDVGLWVDPAQRLEFLRSVVRTGSVRDMEADFTTSRGTVANCLISGVVLELGGKKCCLSITRDITALKRSERALIAAREAALQASRAKSEFLSSMSHEIRTPMNAILGMADLLAETKMTPEQSHYVQKLVSNGHALLALLNDILDLARIESGRMTLERTPFDLREVIEKSAEALAIRAHEKGLELLVRIAPGTPTALVGDPMRLRQILINLLGNAIKFTSAGEVIVTAEPDRTSNTPGAIMLSVRDTGVGIDSDKLETIFEPFTQADSSTTRRFGGSGLGLAIVRRLADLNRAKVWAESQPGSGSTFFVTLTMELQAGIDTAPIANLAGKRVLLADDNPSARAIVAEMLTEMRAHCVAVNSGEAAIAALEAARAHEPAFDAILLDCRMPSLGGIETARRMRSRGVPAGAITLMLTSDEIAHARIAGVNSWIVKPVTMAELRAAMLSSGIDRAPAALPAPPDAAQSPKSAAIIDRPLKIMLADDSADNRLLIRAFLKKTPYQLDEAENGRVAIDKFISRAYDLVLMDVQMPEVDGYTATRAIRAFEHDHNRPRTPILALTASALDEDVRQTREAGCDAHITKPVNKATLLEAIFRAASDAAPARETDNEGAAL